MTIRFNSHPSFFFYLIFGTSLLSTMVTRSASFSASKTVQPTLIKAKESPGTAVKKNAKKKTEEVLVSAAATMAVVMDLCNDNEFPKLPSNLAHTTASSAVPPANPSTTTATLSRQDSAPLLTEQNTQSPPSTPKCQQPSAMELQTTPMRNNHSLASHPFCFYFNLHVVPKLH